MHFPDELLDVSEFKEPVEKGVTSDSAPQEFEHFGKGSAPVAQAVFDLRLEFPECFGIAVRDKHTVVTEPFGTTFFRNHFAFHDSFKRAQQFSLSGKNHYAPKARWEFPLPASTQKFNESSPIRRIVCIPAGKSGGPDSGHSAQSVHFKPRVVRKDKAGKDAGNDQGLENRILLKGCPNLLHYRAVRQGYKIGDTPAGPEHLTDFARLV
jgi:hypothetical protein